MEAKRDKSKSSYSNTDVPLTIKTKHTHDIESLLRNPADVHITHPAGAFLDFHWDSLFLLDTGSKISVPF